MPLIITQHNWRFYSDSTPTPTVPLGDENTSITLANNTDIIRLRLTLEVSGGAGMIGFPLYYSPDNMSWVAFSPINEWNFANGFATEGDTVVDFKLTDSTDLGLYIESNTMRMVNIGAWEYDFAIVPTATVLTNTTYYFMFTGAFIGHTNPQLVTAGPAPPPTPTTDKLMRGMKWFYNGTYMGCYTGLR